MNNIIETTNLTPIEIVLKMDNDGYVTALNLYEFLELNPVNYARWCKTNILENSFAEKGVDFYSSQRKSKGKGNFADDYKLKVSFAKKLAMQSKTSRGEEARCYFIACEDALKRVAAEKQKWEIERAKGVVIRHILTDTIKMKVPDSPHKRFMYPNYTKLIYKTLLNKTMEELKEQYGVKGKESIREYLTADELKEVETLEMLVSSLINYGWGYDRIKEFVQQNNAKKLAG
ncbi:antA/AntB antirepressor family protein [Anaerovorax sp. IOR16]|uniref:antA/AntB antirepressor family protein n=1 Tax=Anaerovorax sp. IOR16 TaxID=2773458 RepID=UPI0019D23C38|nr:antA/AntB antirepressor family protein [Anaerovorax sp. IOR16]